MMGPFATQAFNDRKSAITIKKYIVPWSIAMLCYSFPKMQTINTCREMMIAASGIPTGCMKSGFLVHTCLYWYVPVCTSMYLYENIYKVHTGMY